MPRIGKNEPSYEGSLVNRYFNRFITSIELDPPRGNEVRINGVEVDLKDSDYDYIRKAGKSIGYCSLRTLDRILVRFDLNLSDFELYYLEQGGEIRNDDLAYC